MKYGTAQEKTEAIGLKIMVGCRQSVLHREVHRSLYDDPFLLYSFAIILLKDKVD
jgi:hypothetical protein